jgi:alkylation response protein AidB-like acyl-CoA dehydrogenase
MFEFSESDAEWVPALVNTTKVCAAAITEPGCGSDVRAIQTRAIKDGDNYVITGEKTSVTRGTYADICTVSAKTDPTAGMRDISSFLVPFDLPGNGSSFSKRSLYGSMQLWSLDPGKGGDIDRARGYLYGLGRILGGT